MADEGWPLAHEPLFVTKRMLEQLRPLVRDIIVVPSPPSSNSPEVLGLTAHCRAAETLLAPIQTYLRKAEPVRPAHGPAGQPRASGAPPEGAQPSKEADIVSPPFRSTHTDLMQSAVAVTPAPQPIPAVLDLVKVMQRPEARRRSIAVLPFSVVLSADEDIVFADILTEDITEALFRCPGLDVKVPPAMTDRQLSSGDMERLVRTDGLSFLIGGSLRIIDGEIRFTAKLLDLERGCYVWIWHFDRAAERSVRVLEQLAQEVADAVSAAVASSVVTPVGAPLPADAPDKALSVGSAAPEQRRS